MNKNLVIGVLVLFSLVLAVGGCLPVFHRFDYSAWVVGEVADDGKAMLLFSGDSGETWIRQGLDILPDGKSLNDVFAVNNREVWVVGVDGLVMHTDDGGDFWSLVDISEVADGASLNCISVIEDKVWLSGENGVVVYSEDSGVNWNASTLPEDTEDYLIQGIFAVTPNIVYAVGNKSFAPFGLVLRTENGGESWEKIELPNNYSNIPWIGVKAVDEDHLVLFGRVGHFVVTANGGEQWVTGGPLFPKDINSLVMLDKSHYWAACDFDTIIITEDSGISWKEQESAGTSNSFLMGIDALDKHHALIVGRSAGYPLYGKILRTSNGGNTWEAVYENADDSETPLAKVSIAQNYPKKIN
jgi:photosystem II stability/assembly factor-like uncharacterized protein